MAKISISEASRLTGQDRSTLHRHIKSGKISKDFDADGKPVIDTSELSRVYPDKFKIPSDAVPHVAQNALSDTKQQAATVNQTTNTTSEVELLKLKLQHLEEKLSIEEARRREAEQRERDAKEENKQLLTIVEKQTYLLAPPTNSNQPKKGFWKRLLG